jgi:hypothetical protein
VLITTPVFGGVVLVLLYHTKPTIMTTINNSTTANVTIPAFNSKMGKLIFRLKATKTLHLARLLERAGNTAKLSKLYLVSRWYHEQAYNMGYDSAAFLKDYADVLLHCGKNEEARIFYLRSINEISSAA